MYVERLNGEYHVVIRTACSAENLQIHTCAHAGYPTASGVVL